MPKTKNEKIYLICIIVVVVAILSILIVGLALTALLPVYAPMIRKIKTSIEVEGTGDIAAIDISQE